ncbi:MAG: efflux RND transporter periplasmic adaptor subunit, partial [Haliangium ochraceum]
EPWVTVVQRGRAYRRPVTLGIRGEGTLEIAGGLPEGAEVVLPEGQPLADGRRVRTTPMEP